jgi:uncharacterized protein (TIGR02452 family)
MSKRSHLAELGHETVGILQAGYYDSPSGQRVDIAESVEFARSNTRLYKPNSLWDDPPPGAVQSVIEVVEESTLSAARRLEADNPCCLNFASARNPGGGFLSGSRAQEESLTRASALYSCLTSQWEMYEYNRVRPTCLYSDYMIYSPRVPVIRDEDGNLLEAPYLTSIITAAAVNLKCLERDEEPLIESTMRQRTAKVLRLAHLHGHSTLVLGAWGCGAFHNDPELIATIFADELRPGGPFHNVFAHVVFAILAHPKDGENLTVFRRILPLAASQ